MNTEIKLNSSFLEGMDLFTTLRECAKQIIIFIKNNTKLFVLLLRNNRKEKFQLISYRKYQPNFLNGVKNNSNNSVICKLQIIEINNLCCSRASLQLNLPRILHRKLLSGRNLRWDRMSKFLTWFRYSLRTTLFEV